MIRQFAEFYRAELRSAMDRAADSLANDSAKDFGDYRHMTGVIRGLAEAERALLDIVEAYTEDNDAE